jgi:putative ABC transport system ATP-binding protein
MQTNALPLVRAEALTKVFGEGHTAVRAVDGVDLAVEAGELVLIMGPSGSGKTTLLSMLGGLLRPTSGAVWLGDTCLTTLSEHQLIPIRRQHIGFVFQTFNLWEALNVEENVELVLNMNGVKGRSARDRATAVLSQLGLAARLHFRTRDLSGGEKQRVSLARALANAPQLLLADEPTANLDSKRGRDVMLLLRGIAKEDGRAVVVVSHDNRVREVADRVLWLADGCFTSLSRLAEDPVCRMSVDTDQAVPLQHDGRHLYFCSDGCRQQFTDDPDSFLIAAG